MKKIAQGTQAAILDRVIQPGEGGWNKAAARSILDLQFKEKDVKRMAKLLERNQEGDLSADEAIELDNYRSIGRLIDLMKSRARQSLKS